MNKKLYSTAMTICVAGSCLANDVPTLTIHKSDGERAVVLTELQSIKYADSDMVVNLKDGTQLVFALDDIIVMELGQAPTAIHSLFSHPAETYVITDLRGHVVSSGKEKSITWPTQQGVYIISVGDQSKKLFVK